MVQPVGEQRPTWAELERRNGDSVVHRLIASNVNMMSLIWRGAAPLLPIHARPRDHDARIKTQHQTAFKTQRRSRRSALGCLFIGCGALWEYQRHMSQ
jgi:hypothetical protein